MAPEIFRQDRFNSLLPLLTGGNGASTFDRVGGDVAPLPEISVGPVWTQQQTNEQVNAGKAANTQGAQTQMQQQQRSAAAKGFGGNSPLLAALQNQTQTATQAANSDLERQIRFDTAEGNAQQLLRTQQARQGQWKDREESDIARRQLQESSRNSLLSVLAGLV
ncbi:MAG: hypothetical protein HC888_00825 [Candidatus Competibacteraceae bacterium]|nr:hypothetical protein [Candidatus Competibacteraceae bacterium]